MRRCGQLVSAAWPRCIATDTNLKRQVAIKVLPASVAADAERLARFQREVEVLAALNPHIAAIYGLERSATTTALVMELVEGRPSRETSEREHEATCSPDGRWVAYVSVDRTKDPHCDRIVANVRRVLGHVSVLRRAVGDLRRA